MSETELPRELLVDARRFAEQAEIPELSGLSGIPENRLKELIAGAISSKSKEAATLDIAGLEALSKEYHKRENGRKQSLAREPRPTAFQPKLND